MNQVNGLDNFISAQRKELRDYEASLQWQIEVLRAAASIAVSTSPEYSHGQSACALLTAVFDRHLDQMKPKEVPVV